jgi:hypothetical protein
MLVALQLVGVVVVPLNLTVLVPCVAPKSVPLRVTGVFTGPELGDKLATLGAGGGGGGGGVVFVCPTWAQPVRPSVARHKAAPASRSRLRAGPAFEKQVVTITHAGSMKTAIPHS